MANRDEFTPVADQIPFDNSTNTLDAETTQEAIEEVKFYKRTFTSSEDINIPSDKVLQMHSPAIDGELYLDGEAYIL
tara:strand:+ start:700 stop:930 length:231 start_codon:yes stop_codon:yes gene_type:complete